MVGMASRTLSRSALPIAAALTVLTFAFTASATPSRYALSGTATITAFAGGASVLSPNAVTVAIDFGEVVIDDMTDTLDLDVRVDGPITLDFVGLAIASATFRDASLTGSGGIFQLTPDFFQMAGLPSTIAANVALMPPMPGIDVSAGTATNGFIIRTGDQIEVDIQGVTLARFSDPFGVGDPDVDIKIDFDLDGQQVPIPEPKAALLFGIGAAVFGAGVRFRS